MAFKTFNVGDFLTASDLNTYLMRQSVIVCTSSTRPAPVAGMFIFETDTNMLLRWDGAAWTLPKNVAGGLLAPPAVRTVNAGPVTAETIISGLTIVATVPAARRVRVTVFVRSVFTTYAGTSPGLETTVSLALKEGGTILQSQVAQVPVENASYPIGTFSAVLAPTAGVHTYDVTLRTLAGSRAANADMSGSTPGYLTVEDVGGL